MKPRRPIVRYHGGKWLLAPWIASHFPPHRVYVEPFGGGGSVLLRKARAYAEVYNDLDGEIVNLFRVLRDDGEELQRRLKLTPFARAEFDLSYEKSPDAVETARRTVVRSYMGWGSTAVLGGPSGFRANSNRSGTTPAHDWMNLVDAIPALAERMRGVVIEQIDACDVMRKHDTPEALHYCDPPYVHGTRSMRNPYCTKHLYRHEMTNDQHVAFAECVKSLQGAVVISGYRSALYDDLFGADPDFVRVDRAAHADGARDRVECLWMKGIAAGLFSSHRENVA
jgi:DNA adenine methylase